MYQINAQLPEIDQIWDPLRFMPFEWEKTEIERNTLDPASIDWDGLDQRYTDIVSKTRGE